MSVIEKILVLMEKKNVNARKLTTDLGLSNSCITEWKKGKAKPSIEAVVKIAKYFGVTTDSLLLEEKTDGIEIGNGSAKAAEIERAMPEIPETNREGTDMIQCSVPSRWIYEESSTEGRKVLECYYKLNEDDREYIRCKMLVLQRESIDQKF